MPQMKPTKWMMISMITFLTLILIKTLIFFSPTNKTLKKLKKSKSNNKMKKW